MPIKHKNIALEVGDQTVLSNRSCDPGWTVILHQSAYIN